MHVTNRNNIFIHAQYDILLPYVDLPYVDIYEYMAWPGSRMQCNPKSVSIHFIVFALDWEHSSFTNVPYGYFSGTAFIR